MALLSRGMNQILTKYTGGNKSGALLLTIFVLTGARRRRVYHKARDWSAVQKSNDEIGEACRTRRFS
jgi:hypothetical protein